MNGNQSRAHQFFDRIVSNTDPVKSLGNLVSIRQPEDSYLDFKGADNIQERDVKKLWSLALSGFANTEGGVLIWGIRAEPNPSPTDPSKKIDCATKLALAPHPDTFAQTLKDVMVQATIDPVQGVQIIPFEQKTGGPGFIVCLVPEGMHKPYRAELDERQQYYQRINDKFIVIPHSLLRSLFYPRIAPRLTLVIDKGTGHLLPNPQNAGTRTVVIPVDVTLSNDGNGSGRELFVRVTSNRSFQVANQNNTFTQYDSCDTERAFYSQRPIHPGEKRRIGQLHFHLPQIPGTEAKAEITVFATDSEPVTHELSAWV